MSAYPRAMLQWTVKPRVVARPQAGKSPIAKSAHLCKKNPAGERERTKDLPVKREADTILVDLARSGKAIVHMTGMLRNQSTRLGSWGMP